MKELAVDEPLTIAEIESRFRDEWVLVEDPQTNEALEILAGKVRCHSPDRKEVERTMLELRPKRFAVLFAGQLPHATFVL